MSSPMAGTGTLGVWICPFASEQIFLRPQRARALVACEAYSSDPGLHFGLALKNALFQYVS
jgi:hypothetical protein